MMVIGKRTGGGGGERGSVASAVVAIVLVLIGLAVVGGLLYRLLTREEEKPEAAESPPVNVEVEVVRALPVVEDAFVLPGVVEANRVVHVAAEVAGRIERIGCEEGKACRTGDLLIELNTDLLQADYDRAAAQAEFDAGEYRRMTELEEGGAATERQRDDARARMGVSKATVAAAKARLDRARILSPISGVLNDLPVERGEYVQPGTPVAEIVDMDTAKVVVHVPERDAHCFKRGGKAEVVIDLNGGEARVVGEISYVGELADERTRSTRMEISVDNRGRRVRSGQIVRVRLVRRRLRNVMMIPLLAVIPLEEGHRVYVVNGDEAKAREVKLGVIKQARVQVLEGLGPDAQLIVSGHRLVGDGDRVRIVSSR